MSKIKYSKFRLSRRVGHTIHGHPQDAINFRNYFCGQHGQTSIRKNSEYATQLIAKQSIKFHHNITEKQLHKYYIMASNMKGDANENLNVLLNRRLDITVFRLGVVPTMYSACQMVSHGHILVKFHCQTKQKSLSLSKQALQRRAEMFLLIYQQMMQKMNINM